MHLTRCLKSERKPWIQRNIDYTIKFSSPFSLVNLFLTIRSTYRFLENHDAKLLTAAAAWECQIEDLSLTALCLQTHTQAQDNWKQRHRSQLLESSARSWSSARFSPLLLTSLTLHFSPFSSSAGSNRCLFFNCQSKRCFLLHSSPRGFLTKMTLSHSV